MSDKEKVITLEHNQKLIEFVERMYQYHQSATIVLDDNVSCLTGTTAYGLPDPKDFDILINPDYFWKHLYTEDDFDNPSLSNEMDSAEYDATDSNDSGSEDDGESYKFFIPSLGEQVFFNIIVPIDEHSYQGWKFATECVTILCQSNATFKVLIDKSKIDRLGIFISLCDMYRYRSKGWISDV